MGTTASLVVLTGDIKVLYHTLYNEQTKPQMLKLTVFKAPMCAPWVPESQGCSWSPMSFLHLWLWPFVFVPQAQLCFFPSDSFFGNHVMSSSTAFSTTVARYRRERMEQTNPQFRSKHLAMNLEICVGAMVDSNSILLQKQTHFAEAYLPVPERQCLFSSFQLKWLSFRSPFKFDAITERRRKKSHNHSPTPKFMVYAHSKILSWHCAFIKCIFTIWISKTPT